VARPALPDRAAFDCLQPGSFASKQDVTLAPRLSCSYVFVVLALLRVLRVLRGSVFMSATATAI
jgi:hypothetical protein